ncbi:MAG TPA: NAD-dependent epimerase/dehydratase family protein [Gammaproteobacteria bacterium]|nr:NAD-dependent epimerase/dehydratase family protein [Gammaproteobacteria bacterium]
MESYELNQSSLALVSGASGFIGRNLCQRLRERGVGIRALMRHECTGPWDEVLVADLAGRLPDKVLQGVDTVFHLAGKAHALSETRQDEVEYHAINTAGTQRLLEACQAEGVQRFVMFSSVKAMGEGGIACLGEGADIPPETPYGRSKLDAERLVLNGGYVPHPVVLRLSMVYGPIEKGNLPKMIHAIARGRFPPLPELGNQRSMVHVDDVVRAAILVAERPESAGGTYILTDGRAYSTRQMYEWICEALGKSIPSWYVPAFALKLLALMGDGIGAVRGRRFVFDSDALNKLVGSACYSSDLIQKDLGFKPERSLRESLGEIVEALGLV